MDGDARAAREFARVRASELALYLLDDRALRWALYTDGTPPLVLVVIDGQQFPMTVLNLTEQPDPEISDY